MLFLLIQSLTSGIYFYLQSCENEKKKNPTAAVTEIKIKFNW